MKIALIFNDRTFRESLRDALSPHDTLEYATAADALYDITGKAVDMILLDAVTYPGFGSGDGHINDLAALIPKSEHNDTLLYWEVTLRVIDRIREEGTPNANTPIGVRVSDTLPSSISMGDVLSKSAVRKDLNKRPQVYAIESLSAEAFAQGALNMT